MPSWTLVLSCSNVDSSSAICVHAPELQRISIAEVSCLTEKVLLLFVVMRWIAWEWSQNMFGSGMNWRRICHMPTVSEVFRHQQSSMQLKTVDRVTTTTFPTWITPKWSIYSGQCKNRKYLRCKESQGRHTCDQSTAALNPWNFRYLWSIGVVVQCDNINMGWQWRHSVAYTPPCWRYIIYISVTS